VGTVANFCSIKAEDLLSNRLINSFSKNTQYRGDASLSYKRRIGVLIFN